MKIYYSIVCAICLSLAMFSCQSEDELTGEDKGYLSLSLETEASTIAGTKVAADYNPKVLHVEILNQAGDVLYSTNDHTSWTSADAEPFELAVGTYTVKAHSYNFDGSESGFDIPYYEGSAQVEIKKNVLTSAEVVCTLANVKVTVNFDESFSKYFSSAVVTVSSKKSGVNPVEFVMGETTSSAYFPVANLAAEVVVVNKSSNATWSLSQDITGVKARNHYILNYKVADTGNGNIKVEADDTETVYEYTFEVTTTASTKLVANKANAWSTFANISGAVESSVSQLDDTYMSFEYQVKGATTWTTVTPTVTTDGYTATLKGLTPATTYSYRLVYNDGTDVYQSSAVDFTTETETALYNGGFEYWYTSGKCAYPNEEGVSFWDTSNPGAATYIGSVTTQETSVVHGGSSSAKLASTYAVVKFAAASMYTGSFGELVGTSGAKLNWGRPFTSRPVALHGWRQYAPGTINRVGNDTPSSAGIVKNETVDMCSVYVVLATTSFTVDNTDMSTFPDWATDSRVVAYGELTNTGTTNGAWEEFNIELEYRDSTTKPTHILVVCSASKYGDYFTGSDESVLYLDDFELVYGDSPKVVE